ncbi:transglycosylase SLT domain-containing protein [Nocardioides panacisoli]|uniref:NlpC/P60 domain-containing protein n=1 Tax=Nocardioides panacisoli TaxID=627624 RepID=A0ABP7HYC1_9ACTN
MSIETVAARVAQLQSQFAQFVPAQSVSAGGSGFRTTLANARADTSDGVSGADVVADAKKYLGIPYVWGGTDPKVGLDCSGLVQRVYADLGIDLPRVSADQARQGTPVASLAEAQPGDLLAWDNSSRNNGADHIAIYVGNGKMIEAPYTGANVRLVDVPSTPDYIRRILPSDSASARPVAGTTVPNASARVGADVPYADLINAAAARTGVPGELIAAVAQQESGFDPKAVSGAGAQGLMQLMPGTADSLGVSNPFDPAQAIDGGARLLHDLLQRFGKVDLALAGYNAGPGAVLRYGGVPPYPETQNYVRSVLGILGQR